MTREEMRQARTLAAALAVAALVLAVACSSPTPPTPITEGPRLTCPADLSAESRDGLPVVVSYEVPIAVGGTAPVTVACTPASGSSFAPGATPVSCIATDKTARSATCGFTVRVTLPPRLSRTRFMAFGDSLTQGKPGPAIVFDYPGSYPSRLLAMLAARYVSQTIVVTPEGEGGENTSGGLTRLPTAFAADRPEVVLLLEGVNDLYTGNPAAIAPAIANLGQMIQYAKSRGALVYLATLPPERQGGLRAGAYPLLQEFNADLAVLATRNGATLVDVYTPLSADVANYVDKDGLHLTGAGYQKMAEVFFDRIRATLETTVATAAAPSPDVAARRQGLPQR